MFEKAVWLGKWIAAAALVYQGFYWSAFAVVAVLFFVLPMIFIPIRRRLGLSPIPGDPSPEEIEAASSFGLTVNEYRGLMRARDWHQHG